MQIIKRLEKVPPSRPGANALTTIAAKNIIGGYASRLLDIQYKNDAQARDDVKRVLYLKLYPATEVHSCRINIAELNAAAEDLCKGIKKQVSKLKDNDAKYAALKILKGAIDYQVKNILE